MFVCLGWGSLIWDPRNLPVEGEWWDDGPLLPVEFTRVSNDHRVTLAITPKARELQVLWSRLAVASLEDAIAALVEREDVKEKNIRYSVGYWSERRRSDHGHVQAIGDWARPRGIEAVVWTTLKPRFGGESGAIPNVEQVIASLDGLVGETRDRAEEYVRRAPPQIATAYRAAIEQALGWVPPEV